MPKKRPDSSHQTALQELLQPGQSIELLKELHILTRDGRLNQDSRRKLKQVMHLFGFIRPLLEELEAQRPNGIQLADHGAGKSYLGFLLYDLFLFIIGVGLLVILAVVFVEQSQRRIPVQYAKRVVGRRTYGGSSTYIPIKVNMAGVIPVIFASSILFLPMLITQFNQPAPGEEPKEWVVWIQNNLMQGDQPLYSLRAAASRHKDPDRAIKAARSLRRAELARVAAADLLDMMSVQQVCRSLSFVWDAVLDAALDAEIRAAVAEDPTAELARIAVIGMGRLGGAELGYGSDADVMFVCKPAPGVDDSDAVRWAIGVCDRMRRRLSKPSDDPPLEVDLGLRPEGRSGPVVRTIDSYLNYYKKWGETWEIQALLRATHIAGDKDVALEFLHGIDPLRYPEDGASPETVREVRRMKARVDNERLPRGADPKTHTKLGRGALTDIEWTVQLLILLHSHTVPELHNTSTLECLDVIEKHELINAEDVQTLRAAWLTATGARNALVLVRGKRTDQLPAPGPQLAQVAGAAGWDPAEYQEFLENYLKLTRRARQVVDEVFWGEKTFER